MSGKLYLAAAGSGKTRKIVMDSIKNAQKTLIVTYTNKNYQEIIKRIRKEVGIIPENIKVFTWFSFLLKDGIRAYQGCKFKDRIQGIYFVNGQYDARENKGRYIKDNKIYTNRLAKSVIEINEIYKGKVFERIEKMYDVIYVDEVQDMAGDDLEILKCLMASKVEVVMVGDSRQCTYSTHAASKYKKYKQGRIDEFIKNECKKLDVEIDVTTLGYTYRNNDVICEFANQLYPDKPPVCFRHKAVHEMDGVKIIDPANVDKYLKQTNAVQLRDNKKTTVNEDYSVYNFGESKGLEFDRVLIYPTKAIWDWVIDKDSTLKDGTRARLYVAITRARDSVVFVRKDNRVCSLPNVIL